MRIYVINVVAVPNRPIALPISALALTPCMGPGRLSASFQTLLSAVSRFRKQMELLMLIY